MTNCSKWKRVSSLLVLVLLPVVGSACSVFSERAKCEGMRLRELPLSITALDLSNSSLATLNWTSLAKLDNLEELNMNSCDILLLPADAFLKLHKLVRLDLSFNGLTRLHKDTFKFNTKLRELALDGNQLHFDSSSPFLVSYSITRLQLRDCGIQKISNITFRGMKTLRYLDLSGNKINVLHSGAFNYSALSHDTEYMRQNPLNTYKTSDMERYRKLKDNWEAFAHLAELHVVDLSYNEISKVDNTIFITNTKLVEVNLSGNKPFFDPAAPFLISSSIENLLLKSCGIRQVMNVTFSMMEKLKNLTLSGNSNMRLDPASFVRSSLLTLHVDYADDIESALLELICKNVAVSCDNRPCRVGSAEELHCNNLTRSKQPVRSTPKEGHSSSASPEESETTEMRATSASEVTESFAKDRVFVIFCSSLALVSSSLSVTVLVLYLKNQKSKTNGSSAGTPPSPENLIMLDEEDQGNDCYEFARREPDVLSSVWRPSVVAPQRPLPSPPPYARRLCSYHEYEAVG